MLMSHYSLPVLSDLCVDRWVFPKIGEPQNGWFTMESPIKMDDLGGKTHYFRKHPDLYGIKTSDFMKLLFFQLRSY